MAANNNKLSKEEQMKIEAHMESQGLLDEHELDMDEKIEVKVKISRKDLALFHSLKDYDDYEEGIEVPMERYIHFLINDMVSEKMEYFNLIKDVQEGKKSQKELYERYGNRVLALIPNEEKFYNKVRKIRGY